MSWGAVDSAVRWAIIVADIDSCVFYLWVTDLNEK